MYKDILRSIAGIDIFPVFSLVIFLAVFATVLIKTVRIDRRRLAELSALPLDQPDEATPPAGANTTREGTR